jgi:hypothetical protein
MSILNIFGEEEFRPITKYGVIVPDYFVSRDGRVLSKRTPQHKILNPKYKTIKDGYIEPHTIGLRVNRKENPELFEDYNYNSSQQKLTRDPNSKYHKRLTKDPNLTTIQIKYHRAVMEAWKPIDDYPPIPKEDWDMCPESAKRFMRLSAVIDHIDSDTRNNHMDNLEWTTPKDNNPSRKKYKNGELI